MDITATYLQVPIPAETGWIVTKLEPFVAKICNLDPDQLYKIDKYLYGLPDALLLHPLQERPHKRGVRYVGHNMVQCLFYRITDKETTYAT